MQELYILVSEIVFYFVVVIITLLVASVRLTFPLMDERLEYFEWGF